MLITPAKAVAYVNHGRWVADCPAECNSAMIVTPGQTSFVCGMWIDTDEGRRFVGGCATTAELVWPPDPAGITSALASRPEPRRNWAPAGHRQTLASRTPDGRVVAEAFPRGQTVADLRAERG